MDEDFEIGDVENFSNVKDEAFSHSALVMSSMRRCLDAGSRELKEGWFNKKTDKNGNQILTYIEDTRKVFIESVRTLMMIMACDLDKDAEDVINTQFKEIEDKKQELTKLNDISWEKLNENEKLNYSRAGERHIKGKISHELLKTEMTQFELEAYREIFAELSKLTKRLDFYKAETLEA